MEDKNKTKEQLIGELNALRLKVSDFEKAEKDLHIEESIYGSLESGARAGIYIIQDGKFRFINHYASKFLGYSKEEIIGKKPISFVHPHDRKMVIENAKKMLKGESLSSYEYRSLGNDGRIHWIEEIVRRTTYEGRSAILGNIMDVTERVKSREKQKELENLEASILAAIPHAVIGLKDRRIIFVNHGVETVFGWKENELVGKSTRILYRTDEDYEKMAGLYAKLQRHKTVEIEFPCRRKDGTDIECMVSASRIGESLKEKNIVITYEDITERERAKNELEHSREQLRNLSIHLQSVREKESARIARELHDELGQLLTALNMDLVMLGKKIPQDQVALAERAESSIKLVDMTMNTLKRIYMDLRPGMLDHLGLTSAIRWQVGEFQKRSGIHCRLTIDPEDFSIDTDRSTTIFRILQEALTNIMRHAEATAVRIRLKKTQKNIDLLVHDNGKGIREDEPTKINSFGLIGIRERAYSWGGTVMISGQKGRGTDLKIRIPYGKAEA